MNALGRLIALVLFTLFASVASAHAGVADDPLVGQWRTQNGAIVDIAPGTIAPLQGRMVSAGRGACETPDRDYNLRLTPVGGGRYEGLSNNYRIDASGTCQEQIADASVVITISPTSAAGLTYTFDPAGDDTCFGGCTEQWTRVVPPPEIFACPSRGTSGSAGDDLLNGTEAADYILGGDGNDRINGLGGPDCLLGEGGNNFLDGGDGNDQLFGGRGNDTIRGRDGGDFILSDRGRNIVAGDAGGDFIEDRGRNSVVRGGSGADFIRVHGPARVEGGTNIDVIYARNGQRDRILCRGDADILSVDRIDSVSRCRGVRVFPPGR